MELVNVDPNCELCNGTGWYGDNGPGIKGNREYIPCECRRNEEEVADAWNTRPRPALAEIERLLDELTLKAMQIEASSHTPFADYWYEADEEFKRAKAALMKAIGKEARS